MPPFVLKVKKHIMQALLRYMLPENMNKIKAVFNAELGLK